MTTDKLPKDATHELQNLTTFEVSLVDMPANKRPFMIVKSADVGEPTDLVQQTATQIAALATLSPEEQRAGLERISATLGATFAPPAEVVETQEAASVDAEAEIADKAETAEVVTEDAVDAAAEVLAEATSTEDAVAEVLEEETSESAEKVDTFESALDDLTGSGDLDAFDWEINRVQYDAVKAELTEAQQGLAIAAAELETRVAFLATDHEVALATAVAEVEKTVRAELSSEIEKRDQEIAALKAKVSSQEETLAKATKRTRNTPSVLQATNLLRKYAAKGTAAGVSQIVPAGESEVEKASDPWETTDLNVD